MSAGSGAGSAKVQGERKRIGGYVRWVGAHGVVVIAAALLSTCALLAIAAALDVDAASILGSGL
ncbi:hypothetical protein SAMN05192583_3573 [Sphingomonas gellani]|uniref:Uncharacterized protein n=1 Tax=Sphingomonas gellani TaxID=1166340 RepID=A0A1H8JEN8_9SPHN|nr:hypothetical protein [Sphingomonas gellani]SEN79209.1 hypothetical protein SAMN05192583_3573 [Sphingomonas gellani]